MDSKALFVCLFCFAWLSQGCTHQVRSKKPVQVVKLAPMVFYSKGGKVVRIEQYNDKELFEKGAVAFRGEKYAEAAKYYERILKAFPKSSYTQLATYNLALSSERLERHDRAISLYEKVLSGNIDDETRQHAQFRIGANLVELKKWSRAEKVYAALALKKNMDVSDRLEAMASLGLSQQQLGKPYLAESTYRKTLRLFRKESRKEYLGNDYFASMAQFQIGKIYEDRFRNRKFRTELDKMKEDLEAKASDLLRAQAHYIRTIRLRNPHWIVASLYHIGQLYRHMYHDMMRAPVPKKLSQEERQIYRNMLKKRIRVLLNKAIAAFERNLRAAETLGLGKDKFIVKTREELKRLRQFIMKEYLAEPSFKEKEKGKEEKKSAPDVSEKNPPSKPSFAPPQR